MVEVLAHAHDDQNLNEPYLGWDNNYGDGRRYGASTKGKVSMVNCGTIEIYRPGTKAGISSNGLCEEVVYPRSTYTLDRPSVEAQFHSTAMILKKDKVSCPSFHHHTY